MKKYLIYLFFAPLLLVSCQKVEVEPLFSGTANQRTTEALNAYKKVLTDAPYGWKASYYPNSGTEGGYSFYLKFTTDGQVAMYSDLFYLSAAQSFTSTYQVKALAVPSLVFDTYNYLHLLVDPDPSVWGGTVGQGYSADQELAFKKATTDSVILEGNIYKTKMVLTPITQAENASLTNGALYTTVSQSYNYYYVNNKFTSLVLPNGQVVDLSVNMGNKIFTYYFIYNNSLYGGYSAYYFTTTGIHLQNPITILNYTFQDMYWDNSAKVYYITINNTRINLRQTTKPAMPFRYAIGSLFSGINFGPTVLNQDPSYTSIYNSIKAEISRLSTTAPTRELNDINMYFSSDGGVCAFGFKYTRSTSSFEGLIYYQVNYSGGNYTFTYLGSDISSIVEAGAAAFTDIIENDNFSFDFDPNNGRIAVLKSKNRNFTMYGNIQN